MSDAEIEKAKQQLIKRVGRAKAMKMLGIATPAPANLAEALDMVEGKTPYRPCRRKATPAPRNVGEVYQEIIEETKQ